MLMQQGRIVTIGSPAEVIGHYHRLSFGDEPGSLLGDHETHKRAACSSISFHSSADDGAIRTGYPMMTSLRFRTTKRLSNLSVSVFIYWPSGYLCTQITTASSDRELTLDVGAHVIEFSCPVLELQPGIYRVDVLIESNGEELDRKARCAILRVQPGKAAFGDFFVDHTWSIASDPSASTDDALLSCGYH
jgi:hypothetical protein